MNHISREKETVSLMIALYCRRKEGNATLCAHCAGLLTYAHQRLDACRFGNTKPSCRRCPVHCYAPASRAKIREEMRYAGQRMLFLHPIAAIRHLLNL